MSDIMVMTDKIQLVTDQTPLYILLNHLTITPENNSTYTWEDNEGIEHSNHTQIFRKTLPLKYDKYQFEQDRAYQRKQKLIEISLDIERTLLFGYKHAGPDYRKTMGGLEYFLPHIVHTKSFINSEANFEDFIKRMFLLTNQPHSQIFVLSHINNIKLLCAALWNDVKWIPREKTYSIPMLEYISPHLNVYMLEEKFLKENELFVIQDLCDLQLLYIPNRELYLEKDIHYRDADDVPRDKDEFVAEYGLKIFDTKHNFYITLED